MDPTGGRTLHRPRLPMIFPYRQYIVVPTPGQSSGTIFRPMVPMRVGGAKGTEVIMGLVDTGADVTILPSFLLPLIGADPIDAEPTHFRGVGGQVVTARYCRV